PLSTHYFVLKPDGTRFGSYQADDPLLEKKLLTELEENCTFEVAALKEGIAAPSYLDLLEAVVRLQHAVSSSLPNPSIHEAKAKLHHEIHRALSQMGYSLL